MPDAGAIGRDPGLRATENGMQFLIVDDHPLFRDALAGAVGPAYPDAVLRQADGIGSACALLAAHPGIDLTLLDLSLQGVAGLDGLVTIRNRFPRVPILVVSGHDDPRIMREVLHHGAAGFVPKAVDRAALTRAIADVLAGALAIPAGLGEPAFPRARPSGKLPLPERIARLTPQQLRVMMMIRQGKLNKQIAHELQVGDSTVKAHVSEILRKLEVISRTQVVIDTAALDFDQVHDVRTG
ncbi:response regulator [uncultured Methylobacterium sp.]|uniref:response regulator n=1 Tax=uncultured Methylobacterium sp. TaxID=157278 RepID=UPI0035CBD548